MTQTDMTLSAELRAQKPNANPLRALKMTLFAGCSCLMLVVLASSPQVQKIFTAGSDANYASIAEPQTADLPDTAAPAPAAGDASPAVPQKGAETGTAPAEATALAEIDGSSWMSKLGLPDKGSLFGSSDNQTQAPAVPLVSVMPRSRIPVRKGGLPFNE